MSYWPIADLVSFGSYTFHSHKSSLLTAAMTVATTLTPLANNPYPYNRAGRTFVPYQKPEWHWEYWILAEDLGAGPGGEAAAVEANLNLLFTQHEALNGDGSAGQNQTLVVNKASGGTVSAPARLTDMRLLDRAYAHIKLELVFELEAGFV